jgi:hypothetical protein
MEEVVESNVDEDNPLASWEGGFSASCLIPILDGDELPSLFIMLTSSTPHFVFVCLIRSLPFPDFKTNALALGIER